MATVSQGTMALLNGMRDNYRNIVAEAERARDAAEAQRADAQQRADELDAVIADVTTAGA